ncbi:sulfurtransferase [Robiginitalea marina]|uniref:Sulfurtransferase n=1 Tax=Robiginitalea marina TaxID=2954105 RepID=A0ABT1B0W6_9FLAO|nr:sulfurtransferase [Robiginitalea marina]MCO5725814.1 sulfurtransferase [Robiginitalea marina]
MRWSSSILIIILLLGSCRQQEAVAPVAETAVQPGAYAHPASLVSVDELVRLSGHKHLKVIDFRQREAFDQGHIPGALPMWRSDIEARDQATPGLVASGEALEALLSGLGISPEDTLVVYDDQGGPDAARFWWAMRLYGFEQVRLLNGGLQAWQGEGLPLNAAYTAPSPANFRFAGAGDPSLRIEKDTLLGLLGSPEWALIDTRTHEEYSGKRQKDGALAAGHIPGSLHIDWAESVRYNGDKTFRTPEELAKIYQDLPADRDGLIVTYCHSGVRSAHTSFVLTQLLGYTRVRNYDGSWLEWSSTPGLPIEKDSLTSILN